jgi:hypothetical protein
VTGPTARPGCSQLPPEIAGYNFATAVILGEADRVPAMLDQDPGLARRPDPRFGQPRCTRCARPSGTGSTPAELRV